MVNNDYSVIGYSLLLGLCMHLIYDFLFNNIKNKSYIIGIFEFIYFLFSTYIAIKLYDNVSNGEFRLYNLIFISLGLLIYRTLFRKNFNVKTYKFKFYIKMLVRSTTKKLKNQIYPKAIKKPLNKTKTSGKKIIKKIKQRKKVKKDKKTNESMV